MSAPDKFARADELAVSQTERLIRSKKTTKKFFKNPIEAETLRTIQTLRYAATLEELSHSR